MYKLTNASFEIDGKKILSPTQLTFEPKKVTTLLGHNGCCKSTLMKLLSRQNAPTQGEVFFNEQPLSSYSNLEFAHQVAYLPQHPPITDGVTVRELVCFGRYPWKGAFGRYSKEDYQIVDEAIEKVQIVRIPVHRCRHEGFQIVFGQVHIVMDVVEGHFWLHHPKFRKMHGSV